VTFNEQVQLATQLRSAGFRYYAFISYPHTDAEMKEFAPKFHERFEALIR
jgi:hypothetical protein